MSIFTTLIVLCIIFYALFKSKHEIIFTLGILSLFADNFRIDLGPSLLLIHVVGFLMIPLVIRRSILLDRKLTSLLTTFYIEFLYIILLGVIFGFMVPWTDQTGERLWTQTAPGRTIVSLLRYSSDFVVLGYFYWLFKERKIDFEFLVKTIAIVSIFSFWIGFFDYFFDYKFKSIFFHVGDNLKNRFLGMNGEPKILGRQAAIAYGVILYFILKYKTNKFLVFSLLTNILAVFLSFSATGIVLFFMVNLLILYSVGKIRYIPLLVALGLIFLGLVSQIEFFKEVTLPKITGALLGSDTGTWSEPILEGEPRFFSRFDIFDRLALIFLYDNPIYSISGVGPNLISLPASDYIPTWITFYESGRIDSVPNLLIINVLARSGFFGLALFIFGIYRLLRFFRKDRDSFVIFSLGLLLSIIYFSTAFYAFTGMAIGLRYAKMLKQKLT